MSCIKTGAHVYLEWCEEWCLGDAFSIDPSIDRRFPDEFLDYISPILYFKIVHRSFTPIRHMKHFTIEDAIEWIGPRNPTVDQIAVLLTNGYQDHGYEGVEIEPV